MGLISSASKWLNDQREQIKKNQDKADMERIARLEREAEELAIEEAKVKKMAVLEAEVKKRREAISSVKYPGFFKKE